MRHSRRLVRREKKLWDYPMGFAHLGLALKQRSFVHPQSKRFVTPQVPLQWTIRPPLPKAIRRRSFEHQARPLLAAHPLYRSIAQMERHSNSLGCRLD
jgi:hypothetical protein